MPDVEPVTRAVFPFNMMITNSWGCVIARWLEAPLSSDFCAKRRQCEMLFAAMQHENQWSCHVFATRTNRYNVGKERSVADDDKVASGFSGPRPRSRLLHERSN